MNQSQLQSLLEGQLFQSQKPKFGPRTFLAIKMLPYLFKLILCKLTDSQRSSLQQYILQTFLIEKSLEKPENRDLPGYVQTIVAIVRENPKFWMPHSQPYKALVRQDFSQQNQALADYRQVVSKMQAKQVNIREYEQSTPCPIVKQESCNYSQVFSISTRNKRPQFAISFDKPNLIQPPFKGLVYSHQQLVASFHSHKFEADQLRNQLLQDFILFALQNNSESESILTQSQTLKQLLAQFIDSIKSQNPGKFEFCKLCFKRTCELHSLSTFLIDLESSTEILNFSKQQIQDFEPAQLKQSEKIKTVWSEQNYKDFLKGLLKYFNNQVNNKRIARYMGTSIDPHDVKRMKGKYLRYLKDRCQNKGTTRLQLLQQDINNFNMNLFKFPKLKAKKVRKDSSESSEEVVKNWRTCFS